MSLRIFGRRREYRLISRNRILTRVMTLIIISFMLCSVLLTSLTTLYLPLPTEHREPQQLTTVSPENDPGLLDATGVPTNPHDPDFDWGYEIVPPAPGVPWDGGLSDNPHPDGIPPITTRYKDPAYLKSRTRTNGPNIINETVLLILVNFSDNSSQRTVEELESMVFNTSTDQISMHNYYKEVSYGVCNVTPGYLNGAAGGAWLSLPQIRKYYGQDNLTTYQLRDDGIINDNSWNTSGKGQMIQDALMAADNAGIDFAKYDNDGPDGIPNTVDDDGAVDHLLIIFSGNGQNHYGNDTSEDFGPDDDGGLNDYGRDLVWPSRVFWWNTGSGFGTYDGKKVYTATVNPEDPDFTLPLGVTCHEFGHDLGLPDLYNTETGKSVVGYWELMDQGNYNVNSTGAARPAHMSAWCKTQLGWIQPIIINESNNNQGVHQVNQTTSPTNDSVCYRVNIKGENEYYLIENRNKTVGTYEEGLPDRGILIWHIDDDMLINRILLPTYPYYAIYLEDYNNDLDAENFIAGRNTACWKSGGAVDQADFNVTTAPNTSANGGIPSSLYLDRILDNALWNMTVRILVKDDLDPPGPPKTVQVYDAEFDNGGSINITWDASEDDGNNDDDVLYYNIYINASSGFGPPVILKKSVDATKAAKYQSQIPGLINGVLYNFTIRADDGPNLSPYPGNYTVMPLDNIARPVTSAYANDTYPDDGGNITLTWNLSPDDPIGNASGPADIIWYNITMNDSGHGEGGDKSLLISLGPGINSHKVENLTNNLPYYFIITAVDDHFNKGNSTEVNATPTDEYIGSPINLRVTPNVWTNSLSFTVEWINPIENSGIEEAYYKLDTSPSNNNDFTNNVTGSEIDTIEITDTLSNGIHPVYVWLKDGDNNSNYTTATSVNILYDGTAPGSPLGLSATPSGWSAVNSFTVDWFNPSEVSGIKGVYFSIDTPPKFYNDGIYQPGNINRLTGITVLNEGVHTIYVWLMDNAGNTDYTSNVSTHLSYDRTSPNKPMNIQATPSTWTNINRFNITWTNPSDLSGIIGARYKVGMYPESDHDGIFVAGINITSIDDIKVSETGSYTLYLWLVDNASNVNYLSYNTTTLYFDAHPPPWPINLFAVPSQWTANNSFSINWTNQFDRSGVWGVYYKFDLEPTSNYDGTYVPGEDIHQLNNISVPGNGTHDIYIWLHDLPGNVNYQNNSYIQLYYDALAPGPPVTLTPHPTTIWTNNNSFAVNWTNPEKFSTIKGSGIAGVYYKLDSPPISNTDGTFIDKLGITYIEEIVVEGSGAHKVYVWLKDRLQNVNYQNYSITELLFDDTPPEPPINLTVTPDTWTETNSFNLTWTNPEDHSGIYGLYYWFSAPIENIGKLVIQNNITSLENITIPGQGEYSIYIWLIDNAYNFDYTRNATHKLLFDISPPTIIHSRTSYATAAVPITLTAIVSDYYSGVNEVKLFYNHEGNETYNELNMKGIGNIYTGVIPGEFVTDQNIGYYLYASDNTDNPKFTYYGLNGHTSYKPGSTTDIDITITEEDVMPPIIVHQKIRIGTVGVKIALTAVVTDDGSGVKEVNCFYRAKSHTNFQVGEMSNGNPYYFEIPEHMVTTIGVEYYLFAVDNSPRQNALYFGRDGLTSIDPASDGRYIEIEITTVDTTPPEIIFGPSAINITSTTAIIYWITDEPANSRIDYGLTDEYTFQKISSSFITIHSLILFNLTPETSYDYRVSSTDKINNGPTRSNNFKFTTMKKGEEDADGDGLPDVDDPDDDNDFIPDSWELRYGLNIKNPADANLDSDNDGYSNLREYLADSNPTDPTSNPISIDDITPPTIIHEPLRRIDIFHSVIITAAVFDNHSGVGEVNLYYKSVSDFDYTRLNMTRSGDNTYIYEFPGSEVKSDIEYFIKAVDLAFVPNIIYFGNDGLTSTEPDQFSDIDIDVVDPDKDNDDDEGGFLEDLGKPFGITDAGVCLLVIVIVIVLLICFILALKSAYQARALAKHSAKHKTTTVEGDRLIWEGDELEELDEVEDLAASEDEHGKDDFEVL